MIKRAISEKKITAAQHKRNLSGQSGGPNQLYTQLKNNEANSRQIVFQNMGYTPSTQFESIG